VGEVSTASPTVIVTYTWDSDEHKARCLLLADSLRYNGVRADIDRYHADFPEGLSSWMVHKITDSDFVICVCTATYATRFLGRPEPEGMGLGGRWEGGLIRQSLYTAGGTNERILPVVFDSSDVQHIPPPLNDTIRYQLWTGFDLLLRRILKKPLIPMPDLGVVPDLPPQARLAVYAAEAKSELEVARPQTPEDKMLAEICRLALQKDHRRILLTELQPWLDAQDLPQLEVSDALTDLNERGLIETPHAMRAGELVHYFELSYLGYLSWADKSDEDERVNILVCGIAKALVESDKPGQVMSGEVTSATLSKAVGGKHVEVRFILKYFDAHNWILMREGNSGGVINYILVKPGLRLFVRDHCRGV
jgi:hypothetical protein